MQQAGDGARSTLFPSSLLYEEQETQPGVFLDPPSQEETLVFQWPYDTSMDFRVLLMTWDALLNSCMPSIHLCVCTAAHKEHCAPPCLFPPCPQSQSACEGGGQEVRRAKRELGGERHEGHWRIHPRLGQSKVHLSVVSRTCFRHLGQQIF